jgi:uncharacterized protein YdaU (DUF1376 family)
MPWYPRDFASSTRGWPLSARAIYRELLDAQWDMGGSSPGTLPTDEAQLRKIAAATTSEWRAAWPYVEPKFPVVNGRRRNERLEQHRAAAVKAFRGRSENAKAVNARRRSTQQSLRQSPNLPPAQSPTQPPPQPLAIDRVISTTTTTTTEEKEKSRGLRRESLPLPQTAAGAQIGLNMCSIQTESGADLETTAVCLTHERM